MGPDDAHGADPVGGDLGHQGVEHLQAGGIHHQDLWVVAVAEQAAFPLRADGELIELKSPQRKTAGWRTRRRTFLRAALNVCSVCFYSSSKHLPAIITK